VKIEPERRQVYDVSSEYFYHNYLSNTIGL